MNEFVAVPVPAHLVVEVMKFIADFDETVRVPAEVRPTRPESGPEGADRPSWTREELEIIHQNRGSMPSVELFAQVLSHLAATAPEAMHRDKIAEELGLDGLTMVKKFGAVTRFINNRISSRYDQWPIEWVDGMWSMNSDTADLWDSVTAS